MQLAFLGAGKMATAIARGLVQQGVLPAEAITASDPVPAALAAFAATVGGRPTTGNAEAIAAADVVLLAMKPQDAPAALTPLRGAFAGKLLISICAGLNIAKLSEWTGSARIVRVMPNTPAMVGLGASVFAPGPAVTDADRETTRAILGAIGIVHEMPESALDAVTGVSGSGPAYVFEFIQARVDGAAAQGLDREQALELVVQTVAGAAEMLRQGLGTPDELRQAVTSKGGTTAAGLQVMADADFRGLIAAVIRRATERSVELGKG
jgi:pyrroline-5-carboxylate reductase